MPYHTKVSRGPRPLLLNPLGPQGRKRRSERGPSPPPPAHALTPQATPGGRAGGSGAARPAAWPAATTAGDRHDGRRARPALRPGRACGPPLQGRQHEGEPEPEPAGEQGQALLTQPFLEGNSPADPSSRPVNPARNPLRKCTLTKPQPVWHGLCLGRPAHAVLLLACRLGWETHPEPRTGGQGTCPPGSSAALRPAARAAFAFAHARGLRLRVGQGSCGTGQGVAGSYVRRSSLCSVRLSHPPGHPSRVGNGSARCQEWEGLSICSV